LGFHDLSKPFIDQALSLYSDWGAIAKYEWLLVQFNLCFNTGYSGFCLAPLMKFKFGDVREKTLSEPAQVIIRSWRTRQHSSALQWTKNEDDNERMFLRQRRTLGAFWTSLKNDIPFM
jgi:hypothetical protein